MTSWDWNKIARVCAEGRGLSVPERADFVRSQGFSSEMEQQVLVLLNEPDFSILASWDPETASRGTKEPSRSGTRWAATRSENWSAAGGAGDNHRQRGDLLRSWQPNRLAFAESLPRRNQAFSVDCASGKRRLYPFGLAGRQDRLFFAGGPGRSKHQGCRVGPLTMLTIATSQPRSSCSAPSPWQSSL